MVRGWHKRDIGMQTPGSSSSEPSPEEVASQSLNQAVHNSAEKLFYAKTVFPFNLTPTTLAIDREKVTITYKAFFSVFEVISIRLDDVVSVVATAGPVFGSVKIFNRHHSPEEPNRLKYMWRHDALRAKRLLEGHIIASQRGIDLSQLPKDELVAKLMDLGAGNTNENV